MQYLHIKQLEKYHPGYKDRTLQWAKIYFQMVQGDPDCEMIENEIDWARLIKFILLELQAKKPIPLDERYLVKKGFDLKKRPISLTLQMLHNFINVSTELQKESHVDKEKEEDKDKDKDVVPFWNYFLLKVKKKFKLTNDNKLLITKKLKDYTIDQLKYAVDRFVEDDWEGRPGCLDLIYCIGSQRGKPDNLDKWLNKIPKTHNPLSEYEVKK